MSGRYDVVVCGSGPAGASAALAAVRHGLSVALLEKRAHPRPKLCGGLLTWKSMQLLQHHFGLFVDDLQACEALTHVSDAFRILSKQGLLVHGSLDYPFHFIRREPFDQLLVHRAREAGVHLVEDCRVKACDAVSGRVETDCGEFFGKLIIGADGVNSRVRQCLPQKIRQPGRWKQYLAPAVEAHVSADQWPCKVMTPELYIGFSRSGYGWVFPGKDSVIFGMCGLQMHRGQFREQLAEYLDHLGVDEHVRTSLKSHPLPYGNWLHRPYHQRVLLVGDAAGIVEPLFGEGLFFSMASGLYAGDAAGYELHRKAGPASREYMRRLDDQIMPELQASDALRWNMSKGVGLAGFGSVGLFTRLLERRLGEMVQGKRSYRFLKKKHWDFIA